ncbi:hypothetical protein PIB30_053299 [Stylosanthes scabra]|uniref:RRM domain-containing protein n=1 Tax=Stylosanthes scabra TaxID=79078 RepID=A0ABU6VLL0_9FABA|nr:hypothetical protein [Stylosanthes scabra]
MGICMLAQEQGTLALWLCVEQISYKIGHNYHTHDQHLSHNVFRRERSKSYGDAGEVAMFLDNLPSSTTLALMWKIFGREGKVVDVFLSRKRRTSNNLKFGFVRFICQAEAVCAIERLDGWIVWGCKISVAIAKYGRMRKWMRETE